MHIIQPSAEFLGEVPYTFEEQMIFIEKAGRICYKSEDKITPLSAETFTKMLCKRKHLAMVEHSNFVVCAPVVDVGDVTHIIASLKYTFLAHLIKDDIFYIGGSLTAWYYAFIDSSKNDNNYFVPFIEKYSKLFDLDEKSAEKIKDKSQFRTLTLAIDVPLKLKRFSFKFITSRTMSHELVRHRPASFAQESQRYVCYMNKHEIEFIEPWWAVEPNPSESHVKSILYELFEKSCKQSEIAYHEMRKHGAVPQAARDVLLGCAKTELIVTSTLDHWNHIVRLRTHKTADPNMRRLMKNVEFNFRHIGSPAVETN